MMYFNFVLITVYLVASVVLAVFYITMWKVIKSHLALRAKKNAIKYEVTSSSQSTRSSSFTLSSGGTGVTRKTKGEKQIVSALCQGGESKKSSERRKAIKSNRTTMMFSLITVIYFLSYIPHLVLQILAFGVNNFISELSFTGKTLYYTFLWSFFVNNIANPIVYFGFDGDFRMQVRLLYSCKWFTIQRRNVQSNSSRER